MTQPAPVGFQINDILDTIPPEDRDAFVGQYLCNEAAAVYSRPAGHGINQCPTVSHLTVPQHRDCRTPPPTHRELVTYQIPLDKARPSKELPYPQGLLMDPGIFIRLQSPTTPFEFPFNVSTPYCLPDLGYNSSTYVPFESVSRVVGLLGVCSLMGDNGSFACIMHAAITTDASDNPSRMDGGANICITGRLGLLVDVVSIPPIPISNATTSGSIFVDDCCTKRGLIPLTLSDGLIYYQPCSTAKMRLRQ
jgi:hypothetical protein